LAYNHFQKKDKKILSVFDVIPVRPSFYTSLGYGIPPHSEEIALSFLEDIIEVFQDNSWEILWKTKRFNDSSVFSNAFIRKRFNLTENYMIQVDPEVAATSLVEASDAVISMPFSSPSLIAKVKGVPSIYYDTSGFVRNTESHGLSVLKSKVELKEWCESLSVNHTVVGLE
jgi:polysaccharide biosynthesis PFTS motif protein